MIKVNFKFLPKVEVYPSTAEKTYNIRPFCFTIYTYIYLSRAKKNTYTNLHKYV